MTTYADAGRIDALRALGISPWYEHLERPFSPSLEGKTDPDTRAQVSAVRRDLRERYGLRPQLVGSMPLRLNLPGEVDLDFVVPVSDVSAYRELLGRLDSDSKFRPSAYNKPNTVHAVYQAAPGTFGELPVDLAVTQGEMGRAFVRAMRDRKATAQKLPDDVRAALIARKNLLKHTPFDPGGVRYKHFKGRLDAALEGKDAPTHSKRQPLEQTQKTARVLDPSQEADAAELSAFLSHPELVGHRTPHAESVLETGKVMSGLEALRRGKLKSYESGYLPGLRGTIDVPSLSKSQLAELEAAWLKEQPDYDKIDALGYSRDALKGALIRDRFSKADKHVRQLGEAWRKDHLRIPKLSPHVFVTRGGLLDEEGYGDVGILAHDRRARTSPFLTLITNEAVLSPSSGLRTRTLDVTKGLVVGSEDRIKQLQKKYPDYTYAPLASVLAAGKGLKPVTGAEITQRILPHLREGTLEVRQG